MKVYAIKNKNHEYLKYFGADSDDVYFTQDISLAMLYDEIQKEIIKEAYSNMNWEYTEIIMEESNKLEHTKNQKAIACLKEVLEHFTDRHTYFNVSKLEYTIGDKDKKIIDFINTKIKELEEESI